MPDNELRPLMSELARLLSPRSSTPKSQGLGLAYKKLTYFAERNGLGEEWCDKVMLTFLGTQLPQVEAA